MAEAGKYGRIEVPGIPEDEPVFILRGQDPLTFAALTSYLRQQRLLDVDQADFTECSEAAAALFTWQKANLERVKSKPGRTGELGKVPEPPDRLDGVWPREKRQER